MGLTLLGGWTVDEVLDSKVMMGAEEHGLMLMHDPEHDGKRRDGPVTVREALAWWWHVPGVAPCTCVVKADGPLAYASLRWNLMLREVLM